MSEKKRGLGRGLGDLGLSELLTIPSSVVANVKNEDSRSNLREIPIDKIRPGPYQPRKTFNQESLEELAQSIRSQGLIQPIVLRRWKDGYEIIAGERRWRAAQLAGLDQIPAIIKEVPDKAVVALALIENIQRQDLNVMEEAAAMQRLILEFHLTHEEVAEAVGKSRTLVTNLLRLLKLHPEVRLLVENGHLEMGHARAILSLNEFQQREVAKDVVARALSVRQTEELVRHLQQVENAVTTKTKKKLDPDIAALQNKLSEKLAAPVTIRHGAKGKGKLIIHYYSLEELDGILEKIQ